jgi:asparagine synthase (glutamine-hydrolysing)
MAAMLRPRGPDGYGLYRDEGVGLAHTRLSIIDPAGGSQPMHNEDGSIWITFNGEIFNYIELREQLARLGHRFRTSSDTEVILHAYEHYGQDAWSRLNGQFAFGLWDSRRRRCWLVRDRLGILPLLYARAAGRVLFASETKALFASGHVQPRFGVAGLSQVFTRWAASAPTTVFDGIRSVPPGASICFDEDHRPTERIYWQCEFQEDPQLAQMPLEEAADALQEKLTRAVSLRLRADVPVGAYLSGGLDSSVIGCLIRRDATSSLQTFAIRFQDPAFDETLQQRTVAGLLGTQHHEILCGADEIRDALPEVIWHCETPLLRTAPAPLFLLSQLVRDNGMKVVLTGEGADELLAGYDIFKEDRIRRFWARQPESAWRPALLSKLYADSGRARQHDNRMWQQFFSRDLTDTDHPFYSHRIRWQNTAWTTNFLAPHLRDGGPGGQAEEELERLLPPGWRRWPSLDRAQMIEIATFLSPYLLSCQGDRVAMGHGVEVRYPFLDPDVVDFCARLPRRLRLRGLFDKVLLRKMGSRHLPADIWQRPKKPYRAPMTQAFFAGRAAGYVDDLLCPAALARLGLVEPAAAGRLVEKARRQKGRMSGEREEMALVGVITLQLLGHFYLERFGHRAQEARRLLDETEASVYCDRLAADSPIAKQRRS